MLLNIKNLYAKIEDKKILRGINLKIQSGEIHAIMGPNGSGKSTLASVLAGRPEYEITNGEILFKNKNLLKMDPEIRAREGLFLAFQYPVEIQGVSIMNFMKTALNEKRIHQGKDELDAMDFLELVKEKKALVKLKEELANRNINEGFSGGEKKKLEIFQMAILEPELGILDETDSGLDIDALKEVSTAINTLKKKNQAIIIITHYQRILNYITPDFVHILHSGKIIKSGDKELALHLEDSGYEYFNESQND